MHYFQQRYLREASAFPALAGLLTVDLPNKGLLSGVELRFSGVNAAGNIDKPDCWMHDRLKKIELIVNGSQVVKSYDARQLMAMMMHKQTPILGEDIKNIAGGSTKEYFYINLGRFYHDLEYMLDLSQVADPELRIEYDFTLASCEGWANGVAMTVEPSYYIICHLLRDTSVVPKGYIKTSEIHRVDNAANLNYNMTVPRGPTYANLYLQSWYRNMGIGAILTHAEVNINSDDIIPWRVRPEDWEAQIVRMYKRAFELQIQCYLTGAQAFPFPLEQGWYYGRVAQNVDADDAGGDLWGNFCTGQYRVDSTGLAGAGSVNFWTLLKGFAPFSVWPITLFNLLDSDTWVDTSVLGDFWVRIEENAGATAGVMKLLGDEVVTRYTTPSWP